MAEDITSKLQLNAHSARADTRVCQKVKLKQNDIVDRRHELLAHSGRHHAELAQVVRVDELVHLIADVLGNVDVGVALETAHDYVEVVPERVLARVRRPRRAVIEHNVRDQSRHQDRQGGT